MRTLLFLLSVGAFSCCLQQVQTHPGVRLALGTSIPQIWSANPEDRLRWLDQAVSELREIEAEWQNDIDNWQGMGNTQTRKRGQKDKIRKQERRKKKPD
jgi:hypothetical protein